MTEGQFLDLVKRTTYKPGWKLEGLREMRTTGVRLSLSGNVPNRDNPAETILLTFTQLIDERLIDTFSEEAGLHIIVSWIYDCERHEADEWLRLDGKRIKDPHGADQTMYVMNVDGATPATR